MAASGIISRAVSSITADCLVLQHTPQDRVAEFHPPNEVLPGIGQNRKVLQTKEQNVRIQEIKSDLKSGDCVHNNVSLKFGRFCMK